MIGFALSTLMEWRTTEAIEGTRADHCKWTDGTPINGFINGFPGVIYTPSIEVISWAPTIVIAEVAFL